MVKQKGNSAIKTLLVQMLVLTSSLKMDPETMRKPLKKVEIIDEVFYVPTKKGKEEIKWGYARETFDSDTYPILADEKMMLNNLEILKFNSLEMLETALTYIDEEEYKVCGDQITAAIDEINSLNDCDKIRTVINETQKLLNTYIKENYIENEIKRG